MTGKKPEPPPRLEVVPAPAPVPVNANRKFRPVVDIHSPSRDSANPIKAELSTLHKEELLTLR
jgi:hypothetical protein